MRRGLKVAAGKMTGVSLRRDILQMEDCGAAPVAMFTDFGVVTTNDANAVAAGPVRWSPTWRRARRT